MNPPRTRGPIARLIIGLWDAVNFSRRLVFNILFLMVMVFVLAAIFGGSKITPPKDRSTLVIAPQGRLVEQFSWPSCAPAASR